MRLTAFSDFTLCTLMYLALRPDTLCRSEEIAGALGISGNHPTVRGQRLVRPAQPITVLRRPEPDFAVRAQLRLGG